MRAHRFCFRNIALAVAFTIAPASAALAQSLPDDIPEHFYRAELVILERLVDPANIDEQMQDRHVQPTVDSGKILWMDEENANRVTDLELVDTDELHLKNAINRLERSGSYRVLASAGWYEAFPPDHTTGAMSVALGDWLEGAGQREIEGHISIERRRYLHVGVHLNHWLDTEATLEDAWQGQSVVPVVLGPQRSDLLTWIRETRRMRSGEIHFIDSPTIGVLVYFEPIEEEE
ncbi:MAG: CsiV family protein [Pseudomonadota bacterium]